MKAPVREHETPPGGWRYYDKRSLMKFREGSIHAIFPQVAKAWRANEIEFPDNWQDVIRHEMCEQIPEMECREIGEPERTLTLDDVARFGNSVKNWLAGGGQFVSHEEAERRAAICVKCPENKAIKMCLGCHRGLSWMAEKVGWPSTSKDPELQSCRVCGCLNRLKVHMGLDAIDNTGLKFAEECWQRQTTPS